MNAQEARHEGYDEKPETCEECGHNLGSWWECCDTCWNSPEGRELGRLYNEWMNSPEGNTDYALMF